MGMKRFSYEALAVIIVGACAVHILFFFASVGLASASADFVVGYKVNDAA
jgi:hypothetical protein